MSRSSKTAGWAVVRDKTINKEYDAAHMLSPMPIAMTLGLGSQADSFVVPAIGTSTARASRSPSSTRTNATRNRGRASSSLFPSDYSNHNYLLRLLPGEHGLDPDNDVQLRVVPPPEMVANLRATTSTASSRPTTSAALRSMTASAFLHILSKDIWDGHPCCAFAASRNSFTAAPNSYAALIRAIIDGDGLFVQAREQKADRRSDRSGRFTSISRSPSSSSRSPARFADGSAIQDRFRKRVDFDPFPWSSFAVWIPDADEAVGSDQGRLDYKGIASKSSLRPTLHKLMTKWASPHRPPPASRSA